MLDQRRRRWTNIQPALGQRLGLLSAWSSGYEGIKYFLLRSLVEISIVGSLWDREVVCSDSDRADICWTNLR